MKQGYILLEDRLHGEYKEAFSRVSLYSNTNLIGIDTDSELMMELLDSMLMAQSEGRPVTDVVGTDIQAFCKNFFSEYKTKDRFVDFLKAIYRISWILLVFGVVDWVFPNEEGTTFSNIGSVVIGAACGIVLNLIIYILIRPFVQKNNRIKPSVYNVFFAIVLVVFIVLAIIISGRYAIRVPRFVALLIPGLYILIFMIVQAGRNYKKYGSVKQPKQERISFMSGIFASIEHELPQDLLKEFINENEKRQKKGQEPMTEEEFLQKSDEQYCYRKRGFINSILLSVVALVPIAIIGITNDFDNISQFCIFVTIMLVLDGFLFSISRKSAKVSCHAYENMRKTLKEEGLTLEEYVNM
ncbi:MAG: hypothetical protein Q4D54_04380 [Eubacteriales bacterium]|nr:hypothetical protein [Eubacteriales bacterium]